VILAVVLDRLTASLGVDRSAQRRARTAARAGA